MEKLRDWLDENPKARPLIMLGLVGFLFFMGGIMIAVNKKPADLPLPAQPAVEASPLDNVPTAGGQEQPGQAARRPRTAWIQQKDTPARPQPGLNVPALKTLAQWEEVSWIQESENWDQVRLSDGTEVWVQSKHLSFTHPANPEKPTDAELTVMAFYQAVARKDYAAAYSYLSGPWKSELAFDRFVDGYARTMSLRTEISRVTQLAPDRFQVDVSMIAEEVGKGIPYAGSYVVEKVGDGWDMASGRLDRQAGDSPPREVMIPSGMPGDAPVSPVGTPTVEATPMLESPAAAPEPAATATPG